MCVNVVRSGRSCTGREDLSPIIEASVEHVGACWGTPLRFLLPRDEFAGIEPTSRVRFEHAYSDAARRAQLTRDPIAGSRTWAMRVEVDGQWRQTEFRMFLDEDLMGLGAAFEDVCKWLGRGVR